VSALALLWVVGLTNAFNFMDGIDGIAACQAITAGLGWGFLALQAGVPFAAALGFLLASSSLGFLCHNWSPARVFMGDVGSLFLGFTLAMLPFLVGELSRDRSGTGLACSAVSLMWPFVFDSTFTFLRRLIKGENVFDAHRSHLYQRLVRAGWSHPAVTFLYAVLGITGVIVTRPWSRRFIEGAVNGMLALPPLCLALWGAVIIVERQSPRSATNGSA
jgi:UDP-N-acetylmuramyl pentapeptide phosphotransferase/UDP-N-acetylglucosamine-1-phosphate transferase